MKKHCYLHPVFIIIILSFTLGCEDREEPEPDIVSEIVSELILPTRLNQEIITFTSNKDWEAAVSSPQGDVSWCSIFPLRGSAGRAAIAISTTENTEYDDRSVIITLKTGNTIKTVTIVQKGKINITVQVDIPGSLSSLLGSDHLNIRELTISGRINGDDVRTITYIHWIQYLDISDAFIVSGGSNTYDLTKDNTISKNMFSGMVNLHTLILPKSITTIEHEAFKSCTNLTSINIPSNVTSIDGSAFAYCTSLNEITVSPNNTHYSEIKGVLANEDKTELVAYPSGKSQQYTIPNGIISIGKNAFYGCKELSSITFLNSVQIIKKGAFSYCTGLTSIDFPSSVTTIEGAAFHYCTGLRSVNIGSGIKTITIYDPWSSYGAFQFCEAITEIHIKATKPPYGDGQIPHKSVIKLYVPEGSKEAYENNQYWKGFYQYIEE